MSVAIPELIPISELRLRQNTVLGHLASGPVILTQHGRAAAVLVAPDEWNRLIARLEDLEDAADAIAARQAAEPIMDFDDYLAQRA